MSTTPGNIAQQLGRAIRQRQPLPIETVIKYLADAIPQGEHTAPHGEWISVRLDVVQAAINMLQPASDPGEGRAPIHWKPTGDANVYTIMRGGNWLASIRFNGELFIQQQEAELDLIVSAYNRSIAKEQQ